jgi:hypothetical protein
VTKTGQATAEEVSLARWLALSTAVALFTAFSIHKQMELNTLSASTSDLTRVASSCRPGGRPLNDDLPHDDDDDDAMDVDPVPPADRAPPHTLTSSAPRGLPLPGKLVDGVHEVVHCEL